ncbi:MAG TPA: MobF family relaxase [Solirubrobacterales bacterium]|jgi:conjugative relaxase-like TrwC/TraI family protein|nr:MobF family relaxase [Solirubrobacterales bacterium]
MVGVTKIQRGNAGYWIEAVAEGGDDYYTKPGEAPGEWLGSLAAELGLEGSVDRAGYLAILAGQDPASGDALLVRPGVRSYVDKAGRQKVAEPVLGYDVRFAAPKSVSLIYGLGSEEARRAILTAHDEAVAEGMAYMEANACLVRRGRNGVLTERGRGFVGMGFRHRMSRAGDPALHTHLVISNLTQAESDGRWLTLASPRGRSPFYLHAKAAGYVYQAALRRAIVRDLGLDWGAVENGHADLRIFARELLEHFSQRRAEILADMEKRGTSSARAAEVSAYRTRDAKDYGVREDLRREEWAADAAELGVTATGIDASIDAAAARPSSSRPARSAGPRALEKLEATRSHFDRRDLVCAVADELPDGADNDGIADVVDRLLESSRVVVVSNSEGAGAPIYYATLETWQRELAIVSIASHGEDAGAAVVGDGILAGVLRRFDFLGDDQRAMVSRLLAGGERVVPVAALPGTGKTTALAAAREGWEAAGIPVFGVATARSASAELADAGVPSTSIRALVERMTRWESRGLDALPPGAVVLMDESSTTATQDMERLAMAVDACGGKLVPIGDVRQIGSVGPGGSFGHLTRLIEPIELRTVRRQRDDDDRRVVELAHAGRGSDALDLLRARDRVTIGDSLPDVLDGLTLDWSTAFAGRADAVMIARRNRDVDDLNVRARSVLKERGVLPRDDEIDIGGVGFCEGDQILTRINSPKEISNRERWVITTVDQAGQSLTIRRVGGDERVRSLDHAYLRQTTEHGEPAIQHAYALTAFAAQGKTFDASYALLDPGGSQEDFVVTISRSRGPTFVYAVAAPEIGDSDLGPGRPNAGDELEDVRQAAERPSDEFVAAEADLRDQIEEADLTELFARRAHVNAQLRSDSRPTPLDRALAEIDKRMEATRRQLGEHDDELTRAETGRRPDRDRVAQLRAIVDLGREQYAGLREDRERQAAAAVRLPARDRDLRLQRALISERLQLLQRREVRSERIEVTPMIERLVGPRPADPEEAALWSEGVDLIYQHLYRQGDTVRRGDPLRHRAISGSRDHFEEIETRRRLDEIRGSLALDQAGERSIGGEFTIDL